MAVTVAAERIEKTSAGGRPSDKSVSHNPVRTMYSAAMMQPYHEKWMDGTLPLPERPLAAARHVC
jgi:hypothetical protein